MAVEAYPLHWPKGWPKTKCKEASRFKTTFANARDDLFDEIQLLDGTLPILSTNVELRHDGLPYANRIPCGSSGVSVYFNYRNNQMCFACDKYFKVQDNIQSIKKTIEALRGIERWGASDMIERAFRGFQALPDKTDGSWWAVLGIQAEATKEEVEKAYKLARKKSHPDHDGSAEQFNLVQKAWEQYQNN